MSNDEKITITWEQYCEAIGKDGWDKLKVVSGGKSTLKRNENFERLFIAIKALCEDLNASSEQPAHYNSWFQVMRIINELKSDDDGFINE